MISDAETRGGAVSFRALKLFESIGRLGSVRRAAEECALSQPAVTQALAKLEEQIGVTLVERRANGSYLNEAGQIFRARAQRFFEQVEAAFTELGVAGGANAVRSAARRLSRSQARALVALAERGSFAAGSEGLGISEASLQRAVRDLQSALCKPLFYRTAAGVVVTPAGMLLGRQIKLAMQEIVWGVQELHLAA
ncbi:MAG: LysR family transcriptional regulator, partial [Caulobacteraceae bacterium]|nr:LysR family transcriptional regulator [Caulobacter sp.]